MIAYIVLAHTNMEQLKKLISKLGDNKIIIHIDKKVDRSEFLKLKNSFLKNTNITFIDKRYNCVWGDFSIVRATNECIKYLVDNDLDFSHAILLSGMDFPIKSPQYINKFLNENKNKNFIEYSLDNKYKDDKRYSIYYFKFANLFTNSKLNKLAFRIQYKLSYTLNIKRNHPVFNKVYFGSQWWVLTKNTLRELYNFIKNNPNYIKFYKNTNIPDEFFYQTIIGNNFKKNTENCNLHFMQWEKDSWHPNTFTIKDKNILLSSGDNKLFARKFDEKVDEKIIEFLETLNENEE